MLLEIIDPYFLLRRLPLKEKERELDPLDKGLINLLTRDGRMPVGKIAESLDITPPTVRARIDALFRSGVLRVAGLVNAFNNKELTVAIVGICLERHQELDKKLEQISELDQIHWAAVVTGNYDIIVEVVTTGGMPGLYDFLAGALPQVGGIRSTDSFMVMKAKGKWILYPQQP